MISYDFPEFDSGFEAISEMYARGLMPTVMDYGDELASDSFGAARDGYAVSGVRGFRGQSRSGCG